ncbi:MAG: hypothetical protein HDT13_02430 [Butyrivibrio sp.]|nr:hypothetical protein [Butyrivibrio sp.]
MMKDIITTITALIGCLLGIYNFVYRIVKDKTQIEFSVESANRTYSIIECKKISDEMYDYTVKIDTIVCFYIKNESAISIFFHTLLMEDYIYSRWDEQERGVFQITSSKRTYDCFHHKEGKEIPTMLPFKIKSYDVDIFTYKESYIYKCYESKPSNLIPQSETERRKLYYEINKKTYTTYTYFDVTSKILI